ncbi:hypothetical protein MUP05_01295 [Candidatus Bathyarchaeota archaeon]|nr:hypothetical protein [Candidatus Bathyarchaeota archaeon]
MGRQRKQAEQTSILKNSLFKLLSPRQSTGPLAWLDPFSKSLVSALDQVSRRLYVSPRQRKKNQIATAVAWFTKREWLVIIACGTLAVPSAFYVASTIERVAIVEYTRLATLSWLSFVAGAILNRMRK